MADVIKHAHKHTDGIKNGRVVTGVQKTGEYQQYWASGSIVINQQPGSGSLFSILDTRFDDVRYYTGDRPADA
jgi:hypothetical protein|tara:strand:+ start:170 stop:388 length:219 start_codon:yes stop_codon:yes gene_type:complete